MEAERVDSGYLEEMRRELVVKLSDSNPIVNEVLNFWRRGFVDFEKALIGCVLILDRVNSRNEKLMQTLAKAGKFVTVEECFSLASGATEADEKKEAKIRSDSEPVEAEKKEKKKPAVCTCGRGSLSEDGSCVVCDLKKEAGQSEQAESEKL